MRRATGRRTVTTAWRWAAALALLGGARAAVTTIDVPDTGSGCIDAPPDAVTYGQTVVAPADPTLNAFTIYLAVGYGPRTVRGEVYAWDDAARRVDGPARYQSAPVSVTVGSQQRPRQAVTFATGGVPLAAGTTYLLAVTTLRDPNASPATLYIGCREGDAYPGGAFYTNGGADLTTGWAPFGPSDPFDLAFAATFGTAPAPGPSASPSPVPSAAPAPSASPSPSVGPSPSAVPMPGFADVPAGYWAHDPIGTFARRGITTGCDVARYCPERPVTRAELAVFLERTLGHAVPPNPGGQAFADVPPDYWAYAFIAQFAQLGITTGCGADSQGRPLFCPDRDVTRAEMAVLIDRARGFASPAPPAAATFADVPTGSWAFAQIERFATLGITTGCEDDAQGHRLYCPERQVTRAELAVFLTRAYP